MLKRNFTLFLLASAVLGISQSIDSSVFNNFLNDTFHLSVSQRTFLEFPREFPGFAVVFVSAFLLFLGDIRIAALANCLAALGMIGMGFFTDSYGVMILWILVYSMGQHLFMPVSNSIVMGLSGRANLGKRLGQINAANTAVFLITSIFTALIFKYVKTDYHMALGIGAGAFLLGAILIMLMHREKQEKGQKAPTKPRLVWRKAYSRFYILNILYGARKQIFITFGPWVLIKIFDQGVSTFAVLGFIIAGLGMFFKPLIGHLIDTVGERFVLMGEAVILIIVCLGYAFSQTVLQAFGLGDLALYFVFGWFVLDQMLTAVGMARATYLKKIAVKEEDISPTLSMGVTLDHFVSMSVPWIGGLVWNQFGYEYVFLGGALIALGNLLVAGKMGSDEGEGYGKSKASKT